MQLSINNETHPVSDLALAEAASRGDTRARRKLVDRLLDRTRKKVGYMVGSDNDAEDMTQMALVQILQSVGSYSGKCAIEFWADRITVRTVMHYLRSRKRHRAVERETVSAAPAPIVEDDSANFWVRQRLTPLLQRLNTKQRMAILLRYADGYPVEEIAEMVDAPLNTVRARLRKGRRLMKKWIKNDPQLAQYFEGGTNETN